MVRRSAVALTLATAVSAAPDAEVEPAKPKRSSIDAARVDRAVEQGIRWITAPGRVAPSGSHDVTADELVLYTLVTAGVPFDDAAFRRYLQCVVDREPSKTYSVALAAMALAELDKAGYHWKLERCARFLVDNQCQNGQWSYGEPIPIETRGQAPVPAAPAAGGTDAGASVGKPAASGSALYGTRPPPDAGGAPSSRPSTAPKVQVRQRRRGPPTGDNSNSQYAALGLRACADAGIDLDPRCLRDALAAWEKSQKGDGAFSYEEGSADPWGSMTAGGIGSLCIYRWLLKQPYKKDERVLKAFGWLDKNWDAIGVVKEGQRDEGWYFYCLYGIERAGIIYGTDAVGSRDWYDAGAAYLLDHQNPDGSWSGGDYTPAWRTCLAVLFLKRAARALPKVYTK